MSGLRWHVCETKPRAEIFAREQLQGQDFEVLLPLELRRRIVNNKLCEFEVPIFSGYLFVRFDVSNDRWGAVHSTRGIKSLMCRSDGMPRPLPEKVERDVLSRFAGGPIDKRQIDQAFEIGARLLITEGPFAGYVGACAKSRAGRVWLLLALFGREHRIALPEQIVELAGAA